MKHKCMINVNDEMYNKLVFISNAMGLSITDFLSKLLVTDEFEQTVNMIFSNVANLTTQNLKKKA